MSGTAQQITRVSRSGTRAGVITENSTSGRNVQSAAELWDAVPFRPRESVGTSQRNQSAESYKLR